MEKTLKLRILKRLGSGFMVEKETLKFRTFNGFLADKSPTIIMKKVVEMGIHYRGVLSEGGAVDGG